METENRPESVVVVGSGVGGLTTANLLARMGFEVTVIERNSQAGGLMRSYVRGGVDCPVGVHYVSSLAPGEPLAQVYDYLGLTDRMTAERMGAGGIIDHYAFDDFAFDLPPGLEVFEDRLRQSFPGEGAQISAIMDKLSTAAHHISSLETILSSDPFGEIEMMQPSGRFMEELGCSRNLYEVMGVSTTLVGVFVEDCSLWLHYLTLGAYLTSSWRFTVSGRAMAQAYADRLIELGGLLITGEEVISIDLENGRVSGVTLASGRRLSADRVVAGIHPKVVLDLLPAEAVKPGRRKRVAGLKESRGVFCVQAVVDAKVQPARPHNHYRLYRQADGRRGLVFCQLRECALPGANLLTIIRPSDYEDWHSWFGTESGRRGEDYLGRKEAVAAELLEEAVRAYGPLGEVRVLDTYTPLSVRDWIGAPQGGTYGVERTEEQMLATVQFARRAAPGLDLVGQSVVAPGVLGVTLGALQAVGRIAGRDRLRRELGLASD